MDKKVVKFKLNFSCFSQKAEMGPPLGTLLGNLGINTGKFVKEFNEFTVDLPDYFKLRVFVEICEDKSYTFYVKRPTVSNVLSLCKQYDEQQRCFLLLDDLLIISLFFFEGWPLSKVIDILLGVLGKDVFIKIT